MKPMAAARTEQRLRRFAMGYLAGMNELRRRLITDTAILHGVPTNQEEHRDL